MPSLVSYADPIQTIQNEAIVRDQIFDVVFILLKFLQDEIEKLHNSDAIIDELFMYREWSTLNYHSPAPSGKSREILNRLSHIVICLNVDDGAINVLMERIVSLANGFEWNCDD